MYWLGGWVDLTPTLDVLEKSKISCPYGDSNYGLPSL